MRFRSQKEEAPPPAPKPATFRIIEPIPPTCDVCGKKKPYLIAIETTASYWRHSYTPSPEHIIVEICRQCLVEGSTLAYQHDGRSPV